MRTRKGFTLVELMVVILIVAILAAVAIPIMRGRIDAAKWSEGKAMMGTIASALRAYIAEKGISYPNFDAVDRTALGFLNEDLTGTYFNQDNFNWVGSYDNLENKLEFVITATAGDTIVSPSQVTLTHTGKWDEIP